MGTHTDITECARCENENAVEVTGDTCSFEYCLECGFTTENDRGQLTLAEVNRRREEADLDPLTQLPFVSVVEFAEVRPGQRFWTDDGEHIRLYEDTDEGWNCCELAEGRLANFAPTTQVEVDD